MPSCASEAPVLLNCQQCISLMIYEISFSMLSSICCLLPVLLPDSAFYPLFKASVCRDSFIPCKNRKKNDKRYSSILLPVFTYYKYFLKIHILFVNFDNFWQFCPCLLIQSERSESFSGYLQWQSKLAHSVSPQLHALLPAIPISFALHLQLSLKPQLVARHFTSVSSLACPTEFIL